MEAETETNITTKQTNRQTDKQTNRQTDKQTNKTHIPFLRPVQSKPHNNNSKQQEDEISQVSSTPEHERLDQMCKKNTDTYRFIGQNCNRAFQAQISNDEHYVPNIESFQNAQADLILLSETNIAWERGEMYYGIMRL